MIYKKTILIGLFYLLNINTFNAKAISKKLEFSSKLNCEALKRQGYCNATIYTKWSLNNKYLFVSSYFFPDTMIDLLDIKTGKSLISFKKTRGMSMSPDGRYVVIMYPKHMQLLEMPSGHCIKTFNNLYGPLPSWSKDSKYLIVSESVYFDNYINKQLLYNLQTEETTELDTSTFVFSGYQPTASVHSFINIIWSPKNNYFTRKSENSTLVWKINQPKHFLRLPHKDISRIDWLSDDKFISTSYKCIKLWDIQGNLLKKVDLSPYKTNNGYQPYIVEIKNDNIFISNYRDLWRYNIYTDKKQYLGYGTSINWTPNKKYKFIVGQNNLRDEKTDKIIKTFLHHSHLSLSDNFLAIQSNSDNKATLQLIDISNGKLVQEISIPYLHDIQWSPDGTKLLTQNFSEEDITVWNLVETTIQ